MTPIAAYHRQQTQSPSMPAMQKGRDCRSPSEAFWMSRRWDTVPKDMRAGLDSAYYKCKAGKAPVLRVSTTRGRSVS